MRWLLWVLWNPLTALDLMDGHGKPDHGKLMGVVAFAGLFGLEGFLVLVLHHVPSAWEWLILGSLAFGWPAWRALLRSRSITSTETVSHTITEAIAARRQVGAADGTEPTA